MLKDYQLLSANLELVSERDPNFGDRVFQKFFAKHPQLVGLFGPHSHEAQQDMLTETLVSALDSAQGAPWIESNLEVLKVTHAAADVEDEMYRWWLDCVVDILAQVSSADWSAELDRLWRARIEHLCAGMKKLAEGSI